MRAITNQRKLVEEEHRHAVKRGFKRRLHFENMPWLQSVIKFLLRVSFFKYIGEKNAADLRVEEVEFAFSDLPAKFDNVRILLITDLHLDGMEGLCEKILDKAESVDFDYCILGGDYGYKWDESEPAYSRMKQVAEALLKKSRVFGILGNHDRHKVAKVLNELGVEMLMNEGVRLERGDDAVYLAGIDDCHYYRASDIGLADKEAGDSDFKIMISHSPEEYAKAAQAGYSLYLTGHTHGGQICLPFGVALVTSATVPRKMVKGRWNYRGMAGYTSRGVGTTNIAVRYFCQPEMTIVKLKRCRQT